MLQAAETHNLAQNLPTVEDLLSVDQACFCRGRSTRDHITTLTTFIENGFEKTGAVFLDLTAAHDTIWHTGLLYKLSKCLLLWCVQTVELLLRNRRFRVHMGDDVSSWQRQANGLSQGSVLAPTLFNLYNLPLTHSRRFIYGDEILCDLQAETFLEIECTLTADLDHLAKYCQLWHLKLSTSKTVTSVFHLHNNGAHSELNVYMNGQRLKHDPYPVYLGVT